MIDALEHVKETFHVALCSSSAKKRLCQVSPKPLKFIKHLFALSNWRRAKKGTPTNVASLISIKWFLFESRSEVKWNEFIFSDMFDIDETRQMGSERAEEIFQGSTRKVRFRFFFLSFVSISTGRTSLSMTQFSVKYHVDQRWRSLFYYETVSSFSLSLAYWQCFLFSHDWKLLCDSWIEHIGEKLEKSFVQTRIHSEREREWRKIDFSREEKMRTWEWRVEKTREWKERVVADFFCYCRSSNQWLPISLHWFLHLLLCWTTSSFNHAFENFEKRKTSVWKWR